jgi:uncharacterized coiled-coil protein SlyX
MYPGTYEEFLWSRKQRESAESAAVAARSGSTQAAAPGGRAPKALPPERPAAAPGNGQPANAGSRQTQKGRPPEPAGRPAARVQHASPAPSRTADAPVSYDERKRQESEARKARKAVDARRKRIEDLESRIAEREQAIKAIEGTMAAPGFYDNHEIAKPVIDKHQALMWEVGDLMHQWEQLQQTDL